MYDFLPFAGLEEPSLVSKWGLTYLLDHKTPSFWKANLGRKYFIHI
jgi:hypothetical protein